MNSFIFAVEAVAPMLLLVFLGYLLQKGSKYSSEFSSKLNNLNFDIFMPAMIFNSIYGIGAISDVNWTAVVVCIFTIALIFFIGYVVQRFTPNPKQKGVLWQAIFRSNFALLGLPLSQSIGGDKALAFASAIAAFVQLTFNLLGVFALTASNAVSTKDRIKQVVNKLIRNPLVLASLTGIAVLLIRTIIPKDSTGDLIFSIEKSIPFIYKAIGNLAKVASPLALVTLGMQFSFPKVKTEIKPLVIGTSFKLILDPIIGILIAFIATSIGFAHFGTAEYPAVLALFGTPVGVSSVVVVQSMGGDTDLANRLVVFSSVLCSVTLIIFLSILRACALI